MIPPAVWSSLARGHERRYRDVRATPRGQRLIVPGSPEVDLRVDDIVD